jgi:hypothetical protein
MRANEFAPDAPSPMKAQADAVQRQQEQLKRQKAQLDVKVARDKLNKATAKQSDINRTT